MNAGLRKKRRSRRLPYRRRIRLGKENATYLGYVVNISEHGLQIEARNLYISGTRIVISFQEDSITEKESVEIKVEAMVRWSTRIVGSLAGKMGVEIVRDPEDLVRTIYNERISKLIK